MLVTIHKKNSGLIENNEKLTDQCAGVCCKFYLSVGMYNYQLPMFIRFPECKWLTVSLLCVGAYAHVCPHLMASEEERRGRNLHIQNQTSRIVHDEDITIM